MFFIDFTFTGFLQTSPAEELLPHEGEDFVVIFADRLSSLTETIVDDREKHTETDEDHQNDEQSETDRTEIRRGTGQISGIEFQQGHFEEHLGRFQNAPTGLDLRDEEEVEEAEECHEDDGEHHQKGHQFAGSVVQCSGEQRQTVVVLAETEEFDRAEETAESKEKVQQSVDIGRQLEVDVNIPTRLFEETSQTFRFSISPGVNRHGCPRAGNDSHFDVRPEAIEILAFHSRIDPEFVEHRINDHHHVEDERNQLRHRGQD